MLQQEIGKRCTIPLTLEHKHIHEFPTSDLWERLGRNAHAGKWQESSLLKLHCGHFKETPRASNGRVPELSDLLSVSCVDKTRLEGAEGGMVEEEEEEEGCRRGDGNGNT
ncbi:unnamed protein product [Pleuronectes platessa]|uniref:Uncharacterized protein n=1 Tax=Pleuronectes platessa TaxID=8262 RepID=A0A9N7ZA73_PLEPL|nr:unnamed protein product [Pleuronectes platessa]